MDEVLDSNEVLLQHFLSSDQSSDSPSKCSCHSLPLGSCPEVIQEFFNTVQSLHSLPGHPANMDSLRIPLPRPSFPIYAWRFAIQGYFDADEILAMLQYGWDFSFIEPPNPKDAKRNLVSASIAPQDVDTYIQTELAHGALLGPFNPIPGACGGKLPQKSH